ncbi:MAG: WYL domain-containing protein [Bacteroidetes bacterium]|nr:MAG: WYL domain-containing protein [Bacteroidota bacterium]
MTIINKLRRYFYLISLLDKEELSCKNLSEKTKNASYNNIPNQKISYKTIERDLEDLEDMGFTFLKNKKGEYSLEETFNNKEKKYLLEQTIFYMKRTVNNKNTKVLQYERANLVEQTYFDTLVESCKNCNIITFKYDNFWYDEREYTVEPYLLKQFRNRWYLIAKIVEMSGKKDGLYEQINKQIYNFSLDRFSQEKGIINTKRKFKNLNFDADNFYKDCFGILKPYDYQNKKVEEVILSFEPIQGRYVKKLPLHHSQEIVFEDDNKEVRIRLNVYITYDFVQEIFHFGENVKVIAPESLKDSMQKANAHIKTYYDENDASPSRPTLY